MGNNIGSLRIEAAGYRAYVRSTVGRRLTDLGRLWDSSNPAQPASYYSSDAVIALGPDELIAGRKKIQDAFAGRLGRMHRVLFTMDEFDVGDELVFARGTMRYELNRADGSTTSEIAAFAMSLRVRRDVWLIKSQVIGVRPALVEDPLH